MKKPLTIQTVPNLRSVSDDQRHVLKDVNVEDLKVCDSEEWRINLMITF